MKAALAFALIVLCASVDHSLAQTGPAPLSGRQDDVFRKIVGLSTFIYAADVDPCASLARDQMIAPLGTGFVVAMAGDAAGGDGSHARKFLITAKDVIRGQGKVVLRLNNTDTGKFTCIPLALEGRVNNAAAGIDLAAIRLPDTPGIGIAALDPSTILDASEMPGQSLGMGTSVFTVGHLFDYSGEKANLPVIAFGQMVAVTDEKWLRNPNSDRAEQGYVAQMPVTPGLRGAPIIAYARDLEGEGFPLRPSTPVVVGVVKGTNVVSLSHWRAIAESVTFIEPAANLKAFIRELAATGTLDVARSDRRM